MNGYISKEHQLKAAGVNHCLSFEQVCDEWIGGYGIEEGKFDNVSARRYSVPTVTSIGRVYQTLILNVMGLYDIIVEAIKKYLVHLLVMRYLILIQVCITAIQII